uniref:Uncharacterized protein n=1 Tax=Arundo donax TaxID=35708 RepID=A0A0A8YUM8_ARUDO
MTTNMSMKMAMKQTAVRTLLTHKGKKYMNHC